MAQPGAAVLNELGDARPGLARWILPAFTDSHRHLPHAHDLIPPDEIPERRRAELRRCFASGITSIDDPGVFPPVAWAAKPRTIRTALCGIEGPSEWLRPAFAMTIDEPGHAARVVNDLVDMGADFIKVFATASGRLPRPLAIAPTIDQEVLASVLATAAQRGIPVAAHCHGGEMLAACLRGGVASIEHGLYLSRPQVRDIAEAGARLVMTPLVYLRRHGDAIKGPLRRVAEDAIELGVDLRLGTDSDGWSVIDEILALIDLGIPVERALATAMPLPGKDGENNPWAGGAVIFGEDPVSQPGVLSRPVAVVEPPRPVAAA